MSTVFIVMAVMACAVVLLAGWLAFTLKCFFGVKGELDTMRKEAEEFRNECRKNTKAKERLDTGDGLDDFDNSIDILRHLKK